MLCTREPRLAIVTQLHAVSVACACPFLASSQSLGSSCLVFFLPLTHPLGSHLAPETDRPAVPADAGIHINRTISPFSALVLADKLDSQHPVVPMRWPKYDASLSCCFVARLSAAVRSTCLPKYIKSAYLPLHHAKTLSSIVKHAKSVKQQRRRDNIPSLIKTLC